MEFIFSSKDIMEKYDEFEELSSGAISNVYLAKSRYDGKEVAIKVVTRYRTQDKRTNEYYEPEMEVTKTLIKKGRNANVMNILDLIEENDEYYIIMEYCRRGDLMTLLKSVNFHMDIKMAISVCISIANGLLFLHENNIYHRDLKPENILIANDDDASGDLQVKIADFGVSKHSTDSLMKSAIGTLNYMAPELLQFREYDGSVDIWSFGCLAYEIFTGSQLFPGNSHQEVIRKIISFNEDHLHNKGLDSSLQELVIPILKRCLKRNPKYRIQPPQLFAELTKVKVQIDQSNQADHLTQKREFSTPNTLNPHNTDQIEAKNVNIIENQNNSQETAVIDPIKPVDTCIQSPPPLQTSENYFPNSKLAFSLQKTHHSLENWLQESVVTIHEDNPNPECPLTNSELQGLERSTLFNEVNLDLYNQNEQFSGEMSSCSDSQKSEEDDIFHAKENPTDITYDECGIHNQINIEIINGHKNNRDVEVNAPKIHPNGIDAPYLPSIQSLENQSQTNDKRIDSNPSIQNVESKNTNEYPIVPITEEPKKQIPIWESTVIDSYKNYNYTHKQTPIITQCISAPQTMNPSKKPSSLEIQDNHDVNSQRLRDITDPASIFERDKKCEALEFNLDKILVVRSLQECAEYKSREEEYVLEFYCFLLRNLKPFFIREETQLTQFLALMLRKLEYFQILFEDFKKKENELFCFMGAIVQINSAKVNLDQKHLDLRELTRSESFRFFMKLCGNLLQHDAVSSAIYYTPLQVIWHEESNESNIFDIALQERKPFKISMQGQNSYFVYFN